MSAYRYGWRKQLPDFRDFKFTDFEPLPATTLTKEDLTSVADIIYDQGNIGDCTDQSTRGVLQFDMIKQKLPAFIPSALFPYWNTRAAEGTTSSDSGATIRDTVKAIARYGFCSVSDWPDDDRNLFVKPSDAAYAAAAPFKNIRYRSVVQTATDIKAVLALGYPVIFGFTVYESFESDTVAKTGIVPMPQANESVLGGHAVRMMGFDDDKQAFYVANSWGRQWGLKGYFWMPYEYVLDGNLASDFWVIESVK